MIKKKQVGFTIVEALLLVVIMAVFLTLGLGYSQQKMRATQIDRVALQMQQILNAALVYAIHNGDFPPDISTLQGGGYLPTGTLNSPWGVPYTGVVLNTSTNRVFSVSLTWPEAMGSKDAVAKILMNKLPLAQMNSYTPPTPFFPPGCSASCPSGPPCVICTIMLPASPTTVFAFVHLPGKNLSNANEMNFVGLYHHGGCIPVPTCPPTVKGLAYRMVPQVFVIPVSISGLNDASSTNVYPISSFTGYATAAASSPAACSGGSATPCAGSSASSTFWRACAKIVTERGEVSVTNTATGAAAWGQYVTLGAFVRCADPAEPSGSDFTIFSN